MPSIISRYLNMRLQFLFQQIKRSLFFYVNLAILPLKRKSKNPSKPEVFCLFVFFTSYGQQEFFPDYNITSKRSRELINTQKNGKGKLKRAVRTIRWNYDQVKENDS